MKVLVSDILSTEGLQLLQQADGIELSYRPGLTAEQIVQEIPEYEALIVRSGTQVTEEVLEAATHLKVVGRAGFGVENIDLVAANRKGVVVLNTPLGNATTTAEHTLALLMSLARRIPEAEHAVRSGHWDKEAFVGVEISGKTLGVIGAGKIGSLVVERALGLKMRVLAYDPFLPDAAIQKMGAEPSSLDGLMVQADFITLHVPLTPETEGLINEESLGKMKQGCRLINCAQGGLVDEDALVAALDNGKLAGAALDGFVQEPPPADHPLLQMPQVVCTPHIRAASADAQANVAVQVARQILDFLTRGVVSNALNAPSVSAESLPELQPYLELADRLGGFMAQYGPRAVTEVVIDYYGAVTDLDTGAISRAALKGLLAPSVGASVNYVNAPYVAKERSIAVTESRTKETQGFANMIRLLVGNGEAQASICGTVFGAEMYRIVRVDGFRIEAVPQGNLLLVHNQDVPGVIGFLGQTLAENNINIASMDLSRRTTKGEVACLITIDEPLPDPVLEQLRQHENIFDVTPIALP